MVARLLWEQDAAGSSPVTSTIKKQGANLRTLFFYSMKPATESCLFILYIHFIIGEEVRFYGNERCYI